MPSNRRRHANAVPIAKFATWIVIGIFACGAGLGYVWCKNQIYTTGTQIKSLERDLLELRSRNEVASAKIAKLSSTAALQLRSKNGFFDLVPITGVSLVMADERTAVVAGNELRSVSNERIQK